MYRINLFIKRLFDIASSALLAIILAPIWILISVWIKLDSKGPVFFKQGRRTKDGRVFRMLKFRSMVVNAEQMDSGLFNYENDPTEVRRREGERTRQDSRGTRGEAGLGASPEARRAWGGDWRPHSRPRAADDRRPAEADRSRASGGRQRASKRPSGGEPPPITPHSPPRCDRRIRAMRSTAGRKAVVAGARGKGAWGGAGAR